MANYLNYDPESDSVVAAPSAAVASIPRPNYVPFDPASEAAPPPRSLKDELLRQLGLSAKLGTNIATGTAQTFGNAIAGAANLLGKAGEKIGLPPQQPIGMPSDAIASHFPTPEGGENAVQFIGGLAGGGMDPVARSITRGINSLFGASSGYVPPLTAKQQTSVDLHNANIKQLPEQMEGGKLPLTLQGIGSEAHIEKSMQAGNQPVIQGIAGRATNLPPENLTDAVINHANQEIFNRAYQPVIDAMPNLRPGGLQRQEIISAIRNTPDGAARDAIMRRANDLLRPMTTREAVTQIETLRGQASGAYRSNDPNGNVLGQAYRRLADAMENQIERNLPNNPGLLANFRAGRTEMAKNFAVRDSLVDPNTGIVDPSKMFAQQQSGARLTDGLETIAKAGSPMFSNATRPPIHGEGIPVNWGERVFLLGGGSGIGGGMGYALSGGNPLAAGVGMATGLVLPPVIRSLARKAVQSDTMQNAMARNLTGQPGPLRDLIDRTLLAAPGSYGIAPSLFGGQ